jgi:hypothetical protein
LVFPTNTEIAEGCGFRQEFLQIGNRKVKAWPASRAGFRSRWNPEKAF